VRSDSTQTDLLPYGWLWAQANHQEMHVQVLLHTYVLPLQSSVMPHIVWCWF
jgi:hypothetical protein